MDRRVRSTLAALAGLLLLLHGRAALAAGLRKLAQMLAAAASVVRLAAASTETAISLLLQWATFAEQGSTKMALARFQRTIVDTSGNVVASPTITVRDQVTNALISLFSDRDGLTAISNPFTGTSGGLAAFHAAGGAYKITATSGAFSITWDWVGIGTTQEYDIEDLEDYINNQVELANIGLRIDNGANVIPTGVNGNIVVPFACTVTQWTLLANESGSVVIDIWKDSYANYPPVVGDSITASAKPTISTATKGQSSTLTGWTTSFLAGDILRFNVDSVTSIKAVDINLVVLRAPI
jgi:hypothetical protein